MNCQKVMSWQEGGYSSTERSTTITATEFGKPHFCSLRGKASCGRRRVHDGALLLRGQSRQPWDFPHLSSWSPSSSTLEYHGAWLALVIHTHFSTPQTTEIQDFQVEKGRWMLLYTPDIIKHKTPHRGFYSAGEEKKSGKLIPTRARHCFELCEAAGWSISGWTGLSADIIVIIYYIISHTAAFSIHPQPPPGTLTLPFLCCPSFPAFFYLGR